MQQDSRIESWASQSSSIIGQQQQQQPPVGKRPPTSSTYLPTSPYPPPPEFVAGQEHSALSPPPILAPSADSNGYYVQGLNAPAATENGPDAVSNLAGQTASMSLNELPLKHHKTKRPARAFHTDLAGQQPANAPGGQEFASPSFDTTAGTNGQQFSNRNEQPLPGRYDSQGFNMDMQGQNNSGFNNPNQAGQIDPTSIPNVVSERESQQKFYHTNVFHTMERVAPPCPAIDFAAVDQGAANPKIARLSLNNIPVNGELLQQTNLSLGLVVTPLARLRQDEAAIPLLDFGENGPPRCRRCRAYINPCMQFTDGGVRFVCNMCQFSNPVPAGYFSPLDASQRRIDLQSRPELVSGAVDFVVPKEFYKVDPQPLNYMFAIDVSTDAVNKEIPKVAVEGIRKALYGIDSELAPGVKVGICTFDRRIQFYDLSPTAEQAKMVVMSDIEDPFVPLASGLFVDPEESRLVIEGLLDRIDLLFENMKVPEPAYGSCLMACLSCLEKTGGIVNAFLGVLPTWGPGKLRYREDSKMYNTEQEMTLFDTEGVFYKNLGQKYAEAGVGLNLFVFPTAYCDVASTGMVADLSGGHVYSYPSFVPQRDGKKLINDLASCVLRNTAYMAEMKVRCSNGLQISSYHGSFFHNTAISDPIIGAIDEKKSIVALFKYDGKLDPKLDAHFQCAIMYTTKEGQRRVRSINLVASVTDQLREVVRYADEDVLVKILSAQAADMLPTRTLKAIRTGLTEKAIQILASYRKHGASGAPASQLIMPDGLKQLALNILCLIKTKALRGNNVISDNRIYSSRLLKSLTPQDLCYYLYPRMIALHSLLPEEGFLKEGTTEFLMPPASRASYSCVENGGVYLIDNGLITLIWFHENVSPELLKDLFGPEFDSLEQLDPHTNELPELDTLLNIQVRNILAHIASLQGIEKKFIQLARQRIDGAEYEFASMLVEDRNNDAMSYIDYLCYLHKYIQLDISGSSKTKKKEEESLAIGLRPAYW